MSDAGGFVQHWDGAAWTTRLGPVATDNYYAIAAAGSDVWVGGQFITGSGEFRTRIKRWDGSAWSTVPSPNPTTGADVFNIVEGLAAVSPTDVWAVGSYSSDADPTTPLILHWNGSAWSSVTAPAGIEGRLNAVAANGPNDVWAVGESFDGTSLALHYDGLGWTRATSDSPHPDRNALVSVARSPDDVWAAVGYGQDFPLAPLALGWDGVSNWDSQGVTAPAGSLFSGVAALGWSDMWAAGDRPTPGSNRGTLVSRWNGTSWQTYPGANVPGVYEGLTGIAATPGGNLWAFGHRDTFAKLLYERLCPIKIRDYGFSPASAKVPQGSTVAWSYPTYNAAVHTIQDASGMSLFSDTGDAGEGFHFRFAAAGTYPVSDSVSATTGAIAVPVEAARVAGTLRQIRVVWSASPPAAGLVFDVQRRRNTGAWTGWRSGVTARNGTYTAPSAGKYSFRARLRQPPGTANATNWSPIDAVVLP
jgi:hypothetical protein